MKFFDTEFQSKFEILEIKNASDVEIVQLGSKQEYYCLFYEILQIIAGSVSEEINKVFVDFDFNHKNELKLTIDTDNKSKITGEMKDILEKFYINTFGKFLTNKKISFKVLVCVFMLCFVGGLLFYYNIIQSYYFKNAIKAIKQKDHIMSDLALPHSSLLLKRPHIIKLINEKFNTSEPIKVVVLVGMGGAGKTTVARYYARQQKAKVVWEINAETQESLLRSFKDLAYAFSNTEESKTVLREIEEIKTSEEKEKNLMLFVKNKLKNHPGWFLFYDNVESFKDIQNVFPNNTAIWGNGKIIITTRDENIKSNNYIHHNNVIYVKELLEKEKLELFANIIYNNEKQKLYPSQITEIETFLKELSPFPLDISAAAYYIKDTKISYQEYLDRIKSVSPEFEKNQETLLKENSDYYETRYGIIRLTLQKLIEESPHFKDLLLLVSLVDSKNIPKKLLESFKSNTIVDQFIHVLKKHSFICLEEDLSAFSLHRTTHEMCLTYLTEIYNLPRNKHFLGPVIHALEKYMVEQLDEEDFIKIRNLITHGEKMLNNINLIAPAMKGRIETKLGGAYFHLIEEPKKIIKYLDQGLANLNRYDAGNFTSKAWALAYLGRLHERVGDFVKAKNFCEQSLSIYTNHAKNPTEIARVLSELGMIYRNFGQFEKVEKLFEQCVEIYKKYSINKPTKLAWVMAFLGITCRDLGKYEKSRKWLEESYLLYKTCVNADHNRIGWILTWLGRLSQEAGDYKKAIQLIEQGLEIKKKNFPKDHIRIAWVLEILGKAYFLKGDYKKANKLLEDSLLIYKKNLDNNLLLASALEDLGTLYKILGDYVKSKELLEQSMEIIKIYSKNPLWNTGIMAELGMLYKDLGELEKAKEILEKNIQIYQDNPVHNPISFARHLGLLGIVYRDLGEVEKAKNLLEQNLDSFEKFFGKNHIETARVLRNLGKLYLQQEQYEYAQKLIKISLAIFQQNNHPERFLDLELLADLSFKKINSENKKLSKRSQFQAKLYLVEALEIAKRNLPENSSHLIRIQNKLKNKIR